MKNLAISAIIILSMTGFFLTGCNNGGVTTPTLTLTPASVTVNDNNLAQTVSIGGTATGAVTLNTSTLPNEVTATVDGTAITVTGTRPTTENGSIDDSYTVGVTREGVTENLTIEVNLTTTWTPAPTVTLTPASVTIDDGNLTETVSISGMATGAVTLDTTALPDEVTATVDGTTITVTGVRPTTDVPAIAGSFTVGVTREGITENLTVDVNLTTTWIEPIILSPASVTVNDENLTQTVSVGGSATGAVTLNTDALPDEVTATVSGTTITVTGTRPTTDVPAITGSFTVGVTRESVTEDLTVDVNLTTTWVATVILTPESVTINDGNLTETVSVSGTATGTVELDKDDLPPEVTAEVIGSTITVTGVRPTTEGAPAITGTFTLGVTRQGVTENLTLSVNLTTLTVNLTPASVIINNSNLTRTISVGGTATGTITLDTSTLPEGVTAAVIGTTITVTGVRPTTKDPQAITGSFTVEVTRGGVTEDLIVDVNLTTTWIFAGLYAKAPPILDTDTPIATVAANNVADAVTYINDNADEYTLLLDDDATVSTAQNLNTANVKLTIIGIGSERKILLTAQGRMFTVGASGQAGISLTLGNNITLVGHSSNNNAVVAVQNGAAFTMLDGSKVTGNENSGYNLINGKGSAVYINAATFTMKGGTITGNKSTSTYYPYFEYECAGGLYIDVSSTVRLEGGSITGNTGNSGDVSSTYLFPITITISGDAAVGRLTLTNYVGRSDYSTLAIESGWTGAIDQLDLYSYIESGPPDISNAISDWVNETVLKGTGISAGLSNITLGNFINNLPTIMQAISPTHQINTSGVLVAK